MYLRPMIKFYLEDVPDSVPLSQESKLRLVSFFKDPRHSVMPHELANATGVSAKTAVDLLSNLAKMTEAKLNRCVYHDCEESGGASFLAVDHTESLELPVRCCHCEEQIEEEDELRFDLLLLATGV